MAANKKAEKMYDVVIPKVYAPKGEDALYVSVNDSAIRIKYGVKVRIAERYKKAIDEWLRANERADEYESKTSAFREQ